MEKSIFEISEKLSKLHKITIPELELEINISDYEYIAFLLRGIIEQNEFINERINREDSNYDVERIKCAFEVIEKIYDNSVSYINLRGKDSKRALKLIKREIKTEIINKDKDNILLSFINNGTINYQDFRYLKDLNLTMIYVDAFTTKLVTGSIESDYYEAGYTGFIYREIIRKLGFSLYELSVANLIYKMKRVRYKNYLSLFENGDSVFINSVIEYNSNISAPNELRSDDYLIRRVKSVLLRFSINEIKNHRLDYVEKVMMKNDL